jgi:ABC-2 type transport system permease protein
MRKLFVIALREYNATVRTKAFLIGLVVMPLLMGGSVGVQRLLRDYRDTRDKSYVIIDHTPGTAVYRQIKNTIDRYNEHTTNPDTGKKILPRFVLELEQPGARDMGEVRVELSEQVRKGKLAGFLEIGRDVLRPSVSDQAGEEGKLRYQSNRPMSRSFLELIDPVIKKFIQDERARAAGLTSTQREKVFQPLPGTQRLGLSKRNPATGQVETATEESLIASFAVPVTLMMLMFMVVLVSATPLMQGVVEEKMQRIAEVLLGSVSPFSLMLGKLLGMTAVSLTMALVYLGGGFWAAQQLGFADYVPTSLLLWFVLFQALACLMYGSIFIAIGAACTDTRETQTLVWPVTLLLTLPLFMLANIIQEPNSTVATAISFFPFATPMLMIPRQAVPPGIPWWQPVAGAGVVLLTTLLCVYAAGRIFRVGILMQGKGARISEMIRWVFRG